MNKFLGITIITLCSGAIMLSLYMLGVLSFDGPIVPKGYGDSTSEARDFSELPVHYSDSDSESSISPVENQFFIKDYPDAQEWIDLVDEDLEVVFTSDPELNCGMRNDDNEGPFMVGGCYKNQYPKTLFVYWGDMAPQGLKGFVLAHEYSHYLQWTYKTELMEEGYALPEHLQYDWTKLLESDASCRVVSWGYGFISAQNSSSPCETGDVEWDEGWLKAQYDALAEEAL